ncbi:tetraspanin-2 isoform X1 [Takifugu rubripes]|uniref:tetraspanin-2 isoform X1 n=1 Tax=Takifugu rubripes TaxID=31033 RepID=UPI00114598A4|nr:tetraspanin-2 isoform X1 [Takifugu rubripes]
MSKVQGGMKCVKYLLFVFNFIFWLSGLLVLAVGLWLRFDPGTVELLAGDGAPETFFIACLNKILDYAATQWPRRELQQCDALLSDNPLISCATTLFSAVYILLGAGGLMMVVGFFGCFGAMRESQCLLASFFACLLIIFGAEIVAGVFGFINKEQIVEDVQSFYSNSLTDASSSNYTAITYIYHKTLNCCGGSTSEKSSVLCAEVPEDTKDCFTAITDFFNERLHIIGYIGIGVAGVMIIGMIFSMVLCCAIRNNREVI